MVWWRPFLETHDFLGEVEAYAGIEVFQIFQIRYKLSSKEVSGFYFSSPGAIQYFPTCDCEDKTSHLHTGTKKRPAIVRNYSPELLSMEGFLSTMDAISCLSAFTDLCFLPETSFDRQAAVWVQWSSRPIQQRRRRKLQRYDTNRTKGHFFDKIYIISIFCPSWWWSLFQEERLREEAAKRLERRRKKMLSPEERLARWFLSLGWHLNQIMKVNCWFE